MMRIVFLILMILFTASSCVSTQEDKPAPAAGTEPEVLDIESDSILSGTVHILTENAGTMSEYSYTVLVTGEGQILLFNEKGRSLGFNEYDGKQVQVSGHPGNGTLGFRKIAAEGFFVNGIVLLD